MRIGMILDKIFPPDPRVENEAISLVNNGFEVILFCLKYTDEQPECEILNGIEIKRYRSNRLEYKFSALAYTVPVYNNRMSKKIEDFLVKNNIEAVHIHDIKIAGSVFKVNKKLNLPVVLDLHDNLPEIMKLYPHVQKFPGKVLISAKKWKQKEEEFIHKADVIVTVSDEFKQEVLKRTLIDESKIVVVPNTVRKQFYKNFITDKELLKSYKDYFVILYLGDTGIRRGLLTAIEAITIIKKEIPHCKLTIVGSNTTDPVLKSKVRALNLENYVDFQGWQEVSLFPTYIMASSVCISPLYRNIQHDVAYANKLFQYMSFSKPLVVSDATAQKNLIQRTQTGLVHKEKDSNDLAMKIIDLFKDDKKRKRFGKNGKEFIENKFCWEKTSGSLIKIYQNLNK
jgi:glycosyltransferase involved in cell wall biosynthesis